MSSHLSLIGCCSYAWIFRVGIITGLFYYASVLAEKLHKPLYDFKVNPYLHFRYYSILMHIFLFNSLRVWYLDLRDRPILVRGETIHVQEWTYLWNMHSRKSNNIMFKNYFIRKLMIILQGEASWGLSEKVKKFLRPKDLDPKKKIDHNWGSWLYFKDHTIIRIFGNPITPRHLPIIVPHKVAFFEIMHQLSKIEKSLVRGVHKKGPLLPSQVRTEVSLHK